MSLSGSYRKDLQGQNDQEKETLPLKHILVDYFWKNVLTWYNYYRKYRVFDRVSIN
jgi:hypothetical protein